MRSALCFVFAFALTLAVPARADDPAAATSTLTSAEAPVEATAPALPRLGVAIGAGLPEFATLSLLYRPFRMLRLSAGPTWNYAGWGGDVGVTLVPLNSWISPLLGVQAGRFLRSDYSMLVKSSGASPGTAAMRGLLRRVDYSYTAVDLGLEVGNPRGFSFTLRLGLAWVWADAAGTATSTGGDGTTVSVTNPSVRATIPSAKLGFQYWF
jgi:hypothetical protein